MNSKNSLNNKEWSNLELGLFYICLKKSGICNWNEIINTGLFPSRNIFQMYSQTQNILLQENLSEFKNLKIDIIRIRLINRIKKGVLRNKRNLIIDEENLSDSNLNVKIKYNNNKYGLKTSEIDDIKIPEYDKIDYINIEKLFKTRYKLKVNDWFLFIYYDMIMKYNNDLNDYKSPKFKNILNYKIVYEIQKYYYDRRIPGSSKKKSINSKNIFNMDIFSILDHNEDFNSIEDLSKYYKFEDNIDIENKDNDFLKKSNEYFSYSKIENLNFFSKCKFDFKFNKQKITNEKQVLKPFINKIYFKLLNNKDKRYTNTTNKVISKSNMENIQKCNSKKYLKSTYNLNPNKIKSNINSKKNLVVNSCSSNIYNNCSIKPNNNLKNVNINNMILKQDKIKN